MLPYLPYGARKPEDNNKNVPTPTVIIAHAMPQTSEHTLIGIWLAARRLEATRVGLLTDKPAFVFEAPLCDLHLSLQIVPVRTALNGATYLHGVLQ
ncbi:TPA: hypothetical protein ACH3X2_005981 [Trebouxia sp. C0005]